MNNYYYILLLAINVTPRTAGQQPVLGWQVLNPYSVAHYERLNLNLIDLYAPHEPPLDPNFIIAQTLALLRRGANINEFDKIDWHTPLHMALTNKDITYDLINFLIHNGANVFAATATNESTLAIAARYDRWPEIIKLLLDAGADPSYLDIAKNSALNHLLQIASEHRAANDVQAYNQTLISINLILEALYAFKQQISAYANAQRSLVTSGNYGPNLPATTLSWLAYLGDIDLVKRFLFLFGDMVQGFINQKVDGLTAYDWAEGNSEMQLLLRSYGGQKGLYVPARLTP